MIAIYKIFNNGKRTKKPIAIYDVKTQKEANQKFVEEGIPFRYSENVLFEFVNFRELTTESSEKEN